MKTVLKLMAAAATALTLAGCAIVMPSMDNTEFDLTQSYWSIAGLQSPAGLQELARTHYRINEDQMLVTDVLFDGENLKMVFPSGAYRVVKYTLQDGIATFDTPLFYGSESLGGHDILRCKYRFESIKNFAFMGMSLDGARAVTFYDPELPNPDNVNIENGEWRFDIVEMKSTTNEALYQITGSYGLSSGTRALYDDGPMCANVCIHGFEALFPRETNLDLATIYGGPDWRLPTREEAQAFLKAHTVHYAVLENKEDRECIYLENIRGAQRVFYLPTDSAETGFWLAGGEAVVLTADRDKRTATARVEAAPAGKQFLLWAVKK